MKSPNMGIGVEGVTYMTHGCRQLFGT